MPTACNASTALITLPGPTGSPAARSVRAKCITLAISRPSLLGAAAARTSGLARRGGDLGLDLVEQLGGFAALDAGDVVLVLQEHAERVVDDVRGQFQRIELHQRLGPVDRLGDAGQL